MQTWNRSEILDELTMNWKKPEKKREWAERVKEL